MNEPTEQPKKKKARMSVKLVFDAEDFKDRFPATTDGEAEEPKTKPKDEKKKKRDNK